MSKKSLLDSVVVDKGEFAMQGKLLVNYYGQGTAFVQNWAVSAALHVALHNDTTEVTATLKALSDAGFRSNALKRWFTDDSIGTPMKWQVKDGDGPARLAYDRPKAEALKARYEADKEATIAFLLSKKFNELSKESEFDGFDLVKEIKKLSARASKIAADPTKKDHKLVNLKGLADLQALAARDGATLQ